MTARRWTRNDMHGRWELPGSSWSITVRIRVMGVDQRLLFDAYEGADLVAVRATLKSAQAYVDRRMGKPPASASFFRELIDDPRRMQRAALADKGARSRRS